MKNLLVFVISIFFASSAFAAAPVPPPPKAATTAEMQAGTETKLRSMSPKNVADAIAYIGPGDVTGVGDCAGGACLDGSSDGGTYVRLYDGNSHYTQLSPGDSSANLTFKFPTAYPAGTYFITSTNAGVMGTVDPTGYESHSSNDIDPDRLNGDTVDDNLIAPAIGGAGADTSAMTGRPYLTSGVVSVDDPNFTFNINEPTASDDFLFAKPKKAITITEIGGILQSGTNVVGGVDICDANGANCVAVDSDITFDGDYDRDDTALTAPAVTAGYTLRWHTTSVSAPGYFTVFVYYQ